MEGESRSRGVCRCRLGGGVSQSSLCSRLCSRQQPRSLKLAGPRVVPARPALARPRRPAARGRRELLRAGQTPWGRRVRAMAPPASQRRRRRSTTRAARRQTAADLEHPAPAAPARANPAAPVARAHFREGRLRSVRRLTLSATTDAQGESSTGRQVGIASSRPKGGSRRAVSIASFAVHETGGP
jgi:hypothetical protein